MPTGIYKHKKHTKERCENISKALTGRKHSKEAKKKMSKVKSNEKHPRWRGDKASNISLHIWMAKNKSKPKRCEDCGEIRKLNLASLTNHQYTRNIEDYKWLCYSCHKKLDLKCNYCGKRNVKLHMAMACPDCYHKGFNIWKELFIKRLKEEMDKYRTDNRLWSQPEAQTLDEFLELIDKLAGDKLI